MTKSEQDWEIYSDMYAQANGLEKTDCDQALAIYQDILRRFKPIGTAYYERPAIILEKRKQYDEAIRVCKLALRNLQANNPRTYESSKADFEKRISRCEQKKAGTYRKGGTTAKSHTEESKALVVWRGGIAPENVTFPDWYVSVSFGLSTSSSFERALMMAAAAPIFIRGGTEANPIFQAVFSDEPQEYLAFICLYELVGAWKSSTTIINGKIIDRKIIGKLNYCYGDCCRSGNPRFCFGASEFTDNPFGCHRIQISSYNSPWYSFGRMSQNVKNLWIVDKPAIIKHAESYAEIYSLCPKFNWDKIREEISNLPDTIDLKKNKEYVLTSEGLRKNFYSSNSYVSNNTNITFRLDEANSLNENASKNQKKSKTQDQTTNDNMIALSLLIGIIGVIALILTFLIGIDVVWGMIFMVISVLSLFAAYIMYKMFAS